MNSKESQKKLKKSKSKLKNGGQQVFVLPPNLLQKLGINLGNMESSTNFPDAERQMSTCIPNDEYGHSSSNTEHELNSNSIDKETSIVKTANLMKESVFLSPTFNTAILNNSINTLIGGYIENSNAQVNYTSEKSKNFFAEKGNSTNIISELDLLNNKKLEECNDSDCEVGSTVQNNSLQVNKTTSTEKSVLQNETKKVINIISEETVSVAKLNELKVLQIPATNIMIPASLNTIIGKKSKSSLSEGITDDINIQPSECNDKLINGSNDIKMSTAENNDHLKVYSNTENFCNSDTIKNLMVNNKPNKEVSENKEEKTNSKNSFDNNISQVMLSKTINEISLDDPIVERNLDSRNQTEFVVSGKEVTLTGNEVIDDLKSPTSNNSNQQQNTNVNYPLLNNHGNGVKQVNIIELEPVKLNDITQNIESCLSDIINTNNNTRNHNKSDDILMLGNYSVDDDQQKNIESNSSRSDKELVFKFDECEPPDFIEKPMEKCASIILTNNQGTSASKQEILFDIIDDNMSLTNGLKLVKNQSVCDTTDDEGVNKLNLSLNPMRKNVMSKLCIQGVEKPGGNKIDKQINVSLKKYSNNKKHKFHVKCFSTEKTNVNVKLDHNSNIDLNETRTHSFDCQQFCKCCDYGRLDDNQFEDSYEHIHFSRKKPLDCSPDIIFGIYNNDIIHIEETRENVDHIEDNTDQSDTDYDICWYNAEIEKSQGQEKLFDKDEDFVDKDSFIKINSNHVKDYNVDGIQASTVNNLEHHSDVKSYSYASPDVTNMKISKDKKCCTKNSNNGNKNFQNHSRKRKTSNNGAEGAGNKKIKSHEVNKETSTQIPVEDEVVKQGFKDCKAGNNSKEEEHQGDTNDLQLVKCAVCGMDVINAEWSTHIASKHDYIAWKEGEPSVNLEDEDEIKDHLNQIVQELGQLQCSNCGLIRKYAKAFLHHIKVCYSSSDAGAQIPDHLNKIIEAQNVINCDNCGHKCKSATEHATHVRNCVSKPGLSTRTSIDNSPDVSTPVTCGVCQAKVMSHQWIEHIQREHSYQAWREGEKPLNLQDEESIRKHLYSILQKHGPLVCSKCGKARKYVKLFLQHVQSCTGPKEIEDPLDTSCAEWESVLDVSLDDTGTESTKLVKCGRCQQEMESKQWIEHIKENHKYISWQEGTTPLDTSDDEIVRRYLYIVARRLGSLVCAKCGLARKYVKSYLSHVEYCTGPPESDVNNTINTSELDNTVDANTSQQLDITSPLPTMDLQVQPVTKVKCGVCEKEMNDSSWITHISLSHEYIAWKETDTPIDVNNYEAVWQHLTNVINDIGSLKCAECGRRSKYARAFLLHIRRCYGKTYVVIEDENQSDSDMEASETTLDPNNEEKKDDTRIVKCGVCGQEMEGRLWTEHIHTQHNYLAWRDGDTALDLENEDVIATHLKSIQRKIERLTCAKCGLRRKKVIQFYSHIKACEGPADSSVNVECQSEDSAGPVKCAVCGAEVAGAAWVDHIAKEHGYMAWRDGDNPLDMDDETSVRDHLYKIAQVAGELICSKCGQTRKYVRSYLQHTRACTGSEVSIEGTPEAPVLKDEPSEIVTCALCELEMDESMWMDHIAKEHNYVSWKKNHPPLAFKDETALRDHLYNIVQSVGSLTCMKCGLVRKYAKSYLMHIESCQRVTWRSINKIITKLKKEKGDIVRCAVCYAEMDDTVWAEHIARQHNYLAWRDRDPALNLEDEDDVLRHLRKIIQEVGYLECPKCNIQRKYAKLYLQHVNSCDGAQDDVEMDDTVEETELPSDDVEEDPDDSVVVKCGVCAQEVVKSQWISHIQKEHKYLAWEEGQEPIDVNDKETIYSHLSAINSKCKGLICDSCGTVRKYVKAYLHHVRDCNERNYVHSKETVACGVCREKVAGKMWKEHAMQVHYNIAWVDGDTPIDVRNFFSVDKFLKEYQDVNHKLVCNICGLSRASLAGFYAHILICGKTDEEIDKWKDVCDICHQKYLCIYKTQHYWTHRVQEMAKERKIQETLKREKEEAEKEDINFTPGKRRAAEKARSVIGNYAAKLACYKCKSCPFETDSKEDLARHRCLKRDMYANEDSDDSSPIKYEDFSSEESDDADFDSDLSNDEEREVRVSTGSHRKIKIESSGGKYAAKHSKFPFLVNDARPYLQESKSHYFDLFYEKETLFPNWRESTYEVVPDELVPQYMPQLKESCKLSIGNGGWTTYKIFESKKENGCKVLFTGGSIQCIAWAPEPAGGAAGPALLAAATHHGPDCPRLRPTDTPSHPALIQIWDFQSFKTIPKFAFGLAHDYGTVWAMDWCPSGSRDVSDSVGADGRRPRLGLLAVACSNGSAYILSVPYPDETETSELTFYKIKPCVELRLTRGNNKYQATSINWSMFKGYTNVSVGYGDGTVALFDLATESPLLTAKEGDLNILYPYQDERVHNSCVTGLTSCVLGAWCSSSATGSTAGVAGAAARAGRGARPVRVHAALAASAPAFMPHWPNVMLAGDDTIVGLSPSELEWGYMGRRMGSVRALAPCVRRARVAALVPPLLQVMRPHPAAFKGHKTIHKKNVAMLDMTPLAKKRSKHSNDELSMKVEPITYEDAIASYGIEFKYERDFDKAFTARMQQKHRVSYPERFPLADVPALAYCPAAAHYTKLALATHAGLLLLIDV